MSVPVKVEWEPSKKDRPVSGRYVTVARFLNDEDKWPDEAWSVSLDFHRQNDVFDYENGTANFLVGNAPNEWLKSGAVFEMLEGHNKTAKVTVL